MDIVIFVLSFLLGCFEAGDFEQAVCDASLERCLSSVAPSTASEVMLQMGADHGLKNSHVREEQPALVDAPAKSLASANHSDALLSAAHIGQSKTSQSSMELSLVLCLAVALAFCGIAALLAAAQGPIQLTDQRAGEFLAAQSAWNPDAVMDRDMIARHKHEVQPPTTIPIPNAPTHQFAMRGHPPKQPVSHHSTGGDRTPPGSRSPVFSQRGPAVLCPGLVVPHGNECVLFVATLAALALSERKAKDNFDVEDHGGKPVINVELSLPDWSAAARGTASSGDAPLVLRAASPGKQGRGQILAMCVAHVDATGDRSFFVLNCRGDRFGKIAKSASGYMYSSDRSQPLLFRGEFGAYKSTVSMDDGSDQVIAGTELHGVHFHKADYYRLRVTSGVDVGVVLCGLLAIDLILAC